MFLGLTQGFTEFLPISSSGHLALMENLPQFLEMRNLLEKHYSLLAFNVILHIGTILAVVFYWWSDLMAILNNTISDLKNKEHGEGLSTSAKIVLSTLPVLIVPFFKDFVEGTIQSLNWIALFFIINGLILIISHLTRRSKKTNTEKPLIGLTYKDALIIGIFQVFAVFPGISRSGITITAALFRNVRAEDSVKYSFLISIPVLLGPAHFEIKHIGFSTFFNLKLPMH